jgi:hypothetical protein
LAPAKLADNFLINFLMPAVTPSDFHLASVSCQALCLGTAQVLGSPEFDLTLYTAAGS